MTPQNQRTKQLSFVTHNIPVLPKICQTTTEPNRFFFTCKKAIHHLKNLSWECDAFKEIFEKIFSFGIPLSLCIGLHIPGVFNSVSHKFSGSFLFFRRKAIILFRISGILRNNRSDKRLPINNGLMISPLIVVKDPLIAQA